jgi:hypothetical protein
MRWARISVASVLLVTILAIEIPRLLGPPWAYDSAICGGYARQAATWVRSLLAHVS